MGANAQTTVPTFTASQVLTADQQNQSARTGVPVFASTVTRDAAFGGTGEKTLAEGQLCYVEGTGLQTYNGSSWVTWGTSLPTSGLVRVVAETAFSAVSSVTVDSCFTSTYTNYLINVRYITSTTSDTTFRLRVGGVSAATNYNYQQGGADGVGASAARSTSQTSWLGGANTNGTFYSHMQWTLFSPQLAEPTTYMMFNSQNAGSYTNTIIKNYQGNHTTATAYDGFELIAGSGTISGNYTVYGYAK